MEHYPNFLLANYADALILHYICSTFLIQILDWLIILFTKEYLLFHFGWNIQ